MSTDALGLFLDSSTNTYVVVAAEDMYMYDLDSLVSLSGTNLDSGMILFNEDGLDESFIEEVLDLVSSFFFF